MTELEMREALPVQVKFDLRFAPNRDAHNEMMSIRGDLITGFGNSHRKGRIAEIQLYPVERAGKSGSEVFYLDIILNELSFPERFVAKFQGANETLKEADAATWAEIGQLCTGIYWQVNDDKDIGVVVYKLAAAPDHTEFRRYFLNTDNTNESCAIALRSALQLAGNKYNASAPPQKILKDYARYVQRKNKPLLKLKALCDAKEHDQGLAKLAQEVISGYEKISKYYNIDVHGYLVHGDLHARNLMISRANPARTELIDFDWVHFGHPAKDFVLMETTVKYMLLTELLASNSKKSPGSDENPHISTRCIRDFETFLFNSGLSLPPADSIENVEFLRGVSSLQRDALIRSYECIKEIRASARASLELYCESKSEGLSAYQHYFISFYLVTFGLLAMPDVNQTAAMIGLSIIADNLNGK